MLIIYKQIYLGFCHNLVVASYRIWAPVGADCQSGCSLEGFHSMNFSYPKWNHYNSELQACIILPFVYLLVFLWYLAAQIFRKLYKIHDHMTTKALLISVWGTSISNYLKNLLSLAWFHTDDVLWVTWDLRDRLWATAASTAAQLSARLRPCELPLTWIVTRSQLCFES